MSEKGISVTPEEVRQILSGKKTRTMRLMKSQPLSEPVLQDGRYHFVDASYLSPYQIGDSLWLREPWQTLKDFDSYRPSELYDFVHINYIADSGKLIDWGKFRAGRFLPKRFARPLRLPVTGIKVQRPQDLTLEEIIAEGIFNRKKDIFLRWKWRDKWTEIYSKKSWELNPWCWIPMWEPVK